MFLSVTTLVVALFLVAFGLAHATCEQDALVAELLGVVEPWGLVADLKKQSSAVVP